MPTITRRTALVGGSAAIAAATLPAMSQADDTKLFTAIARWRKVHDIYEDENSRQMAIWARCDAEMPEYRTAEVAHRAALEAAPHYDRTRDQQRQVENTEARWATVREAHNRRLKELGYDEDATNNMVSTCVDACDKAFEVPAHTLAGLSAKMEMKLTEWPYDTFCENAGIDTLLADIQRLAGRAVS